MPVCQKWHTSQYRIPRPLRNPTNWAGKRLLKTQTNCSSFCPGRRVANVPGREISILPEKENLWMCQENAGLSLGSGLQMAEWCCTPGREGSGWGWGRAGKEQGGAQWTLGLKLADDRHMSYETVDWSHSLSPRRSFLSSPLVKRMASQQLVWLVFDESPERSPFLGLGLAWRNKEGT